MGNWSATVGRLSGSAPIPGADRIKGATVCGFHVVVSTETTDGTLGILFPAGAEISPQFLKALNAYRHSHLNENPAIAGFFEDNGRVRSVRLKGALSEAYWVTLQAASAALGQTLTLVEGQEIDSWVWPDGQTSWLCRKYFAARNQPGSAGRTGAAFLHVRGLKAPTFEEHVDTKHWRFVASQVLADPEATLTVSEKYHGTSGRYGLHRVQRVRWTGLLTKIDSFVKRIGRLRPLRGLHLYGRSLPALKWIASRLPKRETLEYVVGTRRVLLPSNSLESSGYHGSNQFRYDTLEWLKPGLAPDMTVYGELVGYANGVPIMPPHDLSILKDKNVLRTFGGNPRMVYSYGEAEGSHRFIVYRITVEGQDLRPNQIEDWVAMLGHPKVCCVHTFSPDPSGSWTAEKIQELANAPQSFTNLNTLREGVVIRVEKAGQEPRFYKEKSFIFKVLEEIVSETTTDLEDEESLRDSSEESLMVGSIDSEQSSE